MGVVTYAGGGAGRSSDAAAPVYALVRNAGRVLLSGTRASRRHAAVAAAAAAAAIVPNGARLALG